MVVIKLFNLARPQAATNRMFSGTSASQGFNTEVTEMLRALRVEGLDCHRVHGSRLRGDDRQRHGLNFRVNKANGLILIR